MHTLWHYTLNTTHITSSHRASVSDDIIDAMAPAIDAGTASIAALPGYSLDIHNVGPAWMLTIRHDLGVNMHGVNIPPGVTVPVTHSLINLARDTRDDAWRCVVATWEATHPDTPVPPRRVTQEPWIATIIAGPPHVLADSLWLADCERVVAWALWELPPPDYAAVMAALPATIPAPNWRAPLPWDALTRAQQFVACAVNGSSAQRQQIQDAIHLRTSPWRAWARHAYARAGAMEEYIFFKLNRRNP